MVAKTSIKMTEVGKFEQGETLTHGNRDVGNMYKMISPTPFGECKKILQSSEMQGVHGDQKNCA